jgi:hypothetical protein
MLEGEFATKACHVDDLYEHEDVVWDGSLPGRRGWKGLPAGFVPCRAQVPETWWSLRETIYYRTAVIPDIPFNCICSPRVVAWSPSNWLQYPDGRPFTVEMRCNNEHYENQ